MNLVIDLGNTAAKLAVFRGQKCVDSIVVPEVGIPAVKAMMEMDHGIEAAILSSVINHDPQLEQFLQQHFRFVKLDHTTPLPLINCYETPETLGRDRLAAAVGAGTLHPQQNVLVIDCGTCIKYDMVTSAGEYLGGAISPGLEMRFNALHTFTDQLPLVTNPGAQPSVIGATTHDSITSGVINGTQAEVRATIDQYNSAYNDLTVLLPVAMQRLSCLRNCPEKNAFLQTNTSC